MVDAALAALAAGYREAEIDAAYAAYDSLPLSEPDRWGNLLPDARQSEEAAVVLVRPDL